MIDKFGDLSTSQFGPNDLRTLRKVFVEKGHCRREVNDCVNRVRRIFSWGVGYELVPAAVAGALRYVKPLEAGKTPARETAPISSVAPETVAATLPHLPPTVDDMVRVQRLIGCRPSEICNIRWCDIDRSDDVWIYTPFEHKTEHKKKARRIAIPQAAQEILKQYHHRPEEEFIFSPRETVRLISERKRAARKTKVQPSQIKRAERALKKALQNPPKHNPKYRTRAYERAIDRAASRAGVSAWSPNQLRHLFATETESRLDKESARLLLGHSHASTTEIYLDENTEKIKSAARRLEKAGR